MEDYSDLIKTKVALSYIIKQYYTYEITQEDAKLYGLEYTFEDISQNNNVKCYFNRFDTECEEIWKILEIDKPIITEHELWLYQSNIRNEFLDALRGNSRDLTQEESIELLKNKLLITTLVLKYYSKEMTQDELKKSQISYSLGDVNINGKVDCCYCSNEDAIKYMWAILKLDGKLALRSDIEFLHEKLSEGLLKNHYKKLEKVKKNNI